MAAVGTVLLMDDAGNQTVYLPSADTELARGTALSTAVAAAAAGDTILIGPGTYRLASNAKLAPPANCTIAGAGMFRTTIKFINTDAVQSVPYLEYKDGCEIRDLKAIMRNEADDAYAAGFVMGNTDSSGTLTALLQNVWLEGRDDGIYCLNNHTEHLTLINVWIRGGWDGIVWRPDGTNSTFKAYDLDMLLSESIYGTGGPADGTYGVSLGPAASTNQSYEIFGGKISVAASGDAHAVRQDSGTLTMNGVRIITATGTSQLAIRSLNDGHHSFSSALNLGPGCMFEYDKVSIASGVTVNYLGQGQTTAKNPLDGTAGNRPRGPFVGAIYRYSSDGKLYRCTDRTTPTFVLESP